MRMRSMMENGAIETIAMTSGIVGTARQKEIGTNLRSEQDETRMDLHDGGERTRATTMITHGSSGADIDGADRPKEETNATGMCLALETIPEQENPTAIEPAMTLGADTTTISTGVLNVATKTETGIGIGRETRIGRAAGGIKSV